MKTFIGIRFEIEGFHNYPDASKNYGESVKFLEQTHRHIFKFNCKKRVNHDNRDEEFILLKRKVKQYLNTNIPVFDHECYDFGSMSCEMIAKQLLKKFDFDSVEVSEDGENYAVVEKEECDNDNEEQLHENYKLPPVTFVIGRAFSGKSYFVNEKANSGDVIIEIGDIIRSINQDNKRIFEKSLSEKVAEYLFDKLSTIHSKVNIYIVGCRQKSIIDGLLYLCESNHIGLEYRIIYLSVPEEIRRKRFEKLVDEEKNKGYTFEEIEYGDFTLGINELITWCIDQPDCLILKTEK